MNKIKLGKRLHVISELVTCDKMYFYDLCCDHGHLGINVLKKNAPVKIILNDQVKSICAKLEDSYADYIVDQKVEVLEQNATQVKLQKKYANFVSICGVGGDLTIKILENLFSQLTERDFLLLSPHTKIHQVRHFLIKHNFYQIKEILVEENDKFYEILLVKKCMEDTNIHFVGHDIWKASDYCDFDKLQQYLGEMVKYYQIKAQYDSSDFIKLILSELISLKCRHK